MAWIVHTEQWEHQFKHTHSFYHCCSGIVLSLVYVPILPDLEGPEPAFSSRPAFHPLTDKTQRCQAVMNCSTALSPHKWAYGSHHAKLPIEDAELRKRITFLQTKITEFPFFEIFDETLSKKSKHQIV